MQAGLRLKNTAAIRETYVLYQQKSIQKVNTYTTQYTCIYSTLTCMYMYMCSYNYMYACLLCAIDLHISRNLSFLPPVLGD